MMTSFRIIPFVGQHKGRGWGSGFIPISEYGSEFQKGSRNKKKKKKDVVRLLYTAGTITIYSCSPPRSYFGTRDDSDEGWSVEEGKCRGRDCRLGSLMANSNYSFDPKCLDYLYQYSLPCSTLHSSNHCNCCPILSPFFK
ncbi:hypothetical protein MLD38_027120 [Melastoma candidum]|uniref:Uncharacterized protein n=1 Tax=Melastoma candidum TaxID=119954 RepID=A0ACB9P0J2_9MYRT|nr:hypothetical protein MLD38_027120 [Melastoma candidum]